MTNYQYNSNMLSLDDIWHIEKLIADKEITKVIDYFLDDPKHTLAVTEGSAFIDYVPGFELDTIRQNFMNKLLSILDKLGNSIFKIDITVGKDSSNLYHKVWTIIPPRG